jgi:hypothetical protein
MADYAVWLTDVSGARIALLDGFETLDFALAANAPGALTLTMPGAFDPRVVPIDGRILVYRTATGGAPLLVGDAAWLVRRVRRLLDADGRRQVVIHAVSALELLQRRIVAYDAATSYTQKTAAADNLIKAIARENLGTLATDTARSWASSLTIAADTSAAPSVTMGFARANVLDTVQKVCQASAQAGTRLYVDIVAPTDATLELRTYTGRRGTDHGSTSTSPVVFGPEHGNLTDPEIDDDYSAEVTYIYAGGQGQEDQRVVSTASDATRIARSPFGRREALHDARAVANNPNGTLLNDEAKAALEAGRPRRRFQATLLDTPGTTYGVHWAWGDTIAARWEDATGDYRIEAIRFTVQDNRETIETRLDATVDL